MAALGIGSATNPVISIIKVLSKVVFLNFIVFFVIYGIKVSWLLASALVMGGYCTAIVYNFLTKGPVYDSLLNMMVIVGFIAIPGLSVLMWFRAF